MNNMWAYGNVQFRIRCRNFVVYLHIVNNLALYRQDLLCSTSKAPSPHTKHTPVRIAS